MSSSGSPQMSVSSPGYYSPAARQTSSFSNAASDFLDDIDSITVSNLTTARRLSTSVSPRQRMSPMHRMPSDLATQIREEVPPPPASLTALRGSAPGSPQGQPTYAARQTSSPARSSGFAARPQQPLLDETKLLHAAPREEQNATDVRADTNDFSVSADDVVPMSSAEGSPLSFLTKARTAPPAHNVLKEAIYPVEEEDDAAAAAAASDIAITTQTFALPVPVPTTAAHGVTDTHDTKQNAAANDSTTPATITTTVTPAADSMAPTQARRRRSSVMLPVPERVVRARRQSLFEALPHTDNANTATGAAAAAASSQQHSRTASSSRQDFVPGEETVMESHNASVSVLSASPAPNPPPGAVRVDVDAGEGQTRPTTATTSLDGSCSKTPVRVRRGTLPGISACGNAETEDEETEDEDGEENVYPMEKPAPPRFDLDTPSQGSPGDEALLNATGSTSLARTVMRGAAAGAAPGQAQIIVAARVRPPLGPRNGASAIRASSKTNSRVVHRKRGRAYLRVNAAEGVIECVGAVGTVDSGKIAGTTASSLAAASASSSSPSHSAAARSSLNFHFDTVFDEAASQVEVMNVVGKRAVDQVLGGYNGTVLCYGQSGCGKTHTMYGPRGGHFSESVAEPAHVEAITTTKGEEEGEENVPLSESAGLAPRMLHRLFASLELKQQQEQQQQEGQAARALPLAPFEVTISALELYNEELRDLLPNPSLLNELLAKKKKKAAAARRQQQQQADANARGRGSSDEDEDEDEEDENVSATPVSKRGKSVPAGASPTSGSPARHTTTMTSTDKRKRAKSAAGTAMASGEGLVIRSGAPDNITKMSVHVSGLQAHKAGTFDDAMLILHAALRERRMGATRLNVDSNRAHMVLFVRVRQQHVVDSITGATTQHQQQQSHSSTGRLQRNVHTSQSVLTLVDLAGSERVSRTGADGVRLREAQSINLSLSTLSNVIRRLAVQAKAEAAAAANGLGGNGSFSGAPVTHIPYRDSKLTRMLQDSFGGNAVTFLLCNLSSDACDFQESVSALRFASDAKHVKNRVVRNTATTTQTLERENAALHKESASLQSSLDSAKAYIAWLERQLDLFARQCMVLLSQQEQGTAAVLDDVAARIHSEKQNGPAEVEVTQGGASPGVKQQVMEAYTQLHEELVRQQERLAQLETEVHGEQTDEAEEQEAASLPSPKLNLPGADASLPSTVDEAKRSVSESDGSRSRRMSTSTERVIVSEYVGVARELRDERDARAADHEAWLAAEAKVAALEETLAEKETIIQALQASLDDKYREEDAAKQRRAAEESEVAIAMIGRYGRRASAGVSGESDDDDAFTPFGVPAKVMSSPALVDLLADYRSTDEAVAGAKTNGDDEDEDSDTVHRAEGAEPFSFAPRGGDDTAFYKACKAETFDAETQTELCGILSSQLPLTTSSSSGEHKHDNTHDVEDDGEAGLALMPLMPVQSSPSWHSVDGSEGCFLSRGVTPPASSLRASRRLWSRDPHPSLATDGDGEDTAGELIQANASSRLGRLLAGFRLAAALAKSEPNIS